MNRHFSMADSIADYSSTQTPSSQLRMSLQEAQVQATLALAYEQRTANAIAMLGEGTWQDVRDRDALVGQIKERLGIA